MKQVIVVRDDLKLPKGKMSVQVAHASSQCVLNTDRDYLKEWQREGMKKVVLKVKDIKELMDVKVQAEDAGLVRYLVHDAGKTVVEPGTVTCLGIGPDTDEKIDKITSHLKMV